ncbi:MAG: transposase [Ignavibacteria bacterium]|nr:transposase [Ignavibacteria bacterium]
MNTLWIGMDISKGHVDVTALCDDASKDKRRSDTVLFSRKFDDTRDGHTDLSTLLHTVIISASPPSAVYIGMEATGGYQGNWERWAREEQHLLAAYTSVRVYVLNPLAVKRYLDRELHRAVTDSSSALGIAQYLAYGMRAADTPSTAAMEGATQYYRAIRSMIRRAASLMTELESLLQRTHPELIRYCRDGIPPWVLQLIERYPTSTLLGRARPETLVRIPGVTTKTAETIIAAAKTSVASLTDPYTQLCIEAMASDLRQARERIEKHRRQIIAMMQDDPVIGIMPASRGSGTGVRSVCVWSSATSNGSIRLPHWSRMSASIPSSSKAEMASSAAGISKRGNARVRAILYLCAMAAERYNPVIAAMAQRLKENGKAPRVRLVAGMRGCLAWCMYAGCPIGASILRIGSATSSVRKAMEERAERRRKNGAAVLSGKPCKNAQRPDYLARVKKRKATAVLQGVLTDEYVVLVPPSVAQEWKGRTETYITDV